VAGVKLNNNTATDTQSERRVGVGVAVAGVKLNNNTATDTQSERRFLNSKTKQITEKMAKLWLE
jgi:hypothetical protein